MLGCFHLEDATAETLLELPIFGEACWSFVLRTSWVVVVEQQCETGTNRGGVKVSASGMD
jgi:hypothetical protein